MRMYAERLVNISKDNVPAEGYPGRPKRRSELVVRTGAIAYN
jgi:hypothetical protein